MLIVREVNWSSFMTFTEPAVHARVGAHEIPAACDALFDRFPDELLSYVSCLCEAGIWSEESIGDECEDDNKGEDAKKQDFRQFVTGVCSR
jgi:hypothetical protein